MEIVKVTIPHAVMDAVPPAERTFILALGFLANQLNALSKLLAIAVRPVQAATVEQHGRHMQFGFLLRLLAGQLKEGRELLRTHYFGGRVSQIYAGRLPQSGRDALTQLLRYFDGDNLINTVRSQYAFHVPADQLRAAWEQDGESYELYLGEARGCCLYWGSESLAMWKVITSAGDGDPAVGMDRLFAEVFTISDQFQAFADGCILVFSQNVGMDGGAVSRETITVGDIPELDSLDLPYIVLSHRGRGGP